MQTYKKVVTKNELVESYRTDFPGLKDKLQRTIGIEVSVRRVETRDKTEDDHGYYNMKLNNDVLFKATSQPLRNNGRYQAGSEHGYFLTQEEASATCKKAVENYDKRMKKQFAKIGA